MLVMKSPSEARQAILEAAEELFARYGFKKTSIDDIAQAARIGKGTVYLHFSSKEQLFAEFVRRVSVRMHDTLTTAVKRAPTPAAKLRAFITTKLTAIAVLASEMQLRDDTIFELLPLAASHRDVHFARERSLLVQVLRDGAASGAFVVEQPDRLATGMMAWLETYDVIAVRRREDPEFRAAMDEFVALVLRGLSPGALSHSA
ncbi:MAG TPA: helix-turn-helix domain-containing protein [Anaeromyxobacteraceae bacterium]|jgi:AcrR family transcriptional regulator|nr:helix-turn-helix domain-containing protein [Anaeromyxobacteraceae bacterium]